MNILCNVFMMDDVEDLVDGDDGRNPVLIS